MFQASQNNIVVSVTTKYIGHYSNIIKASHLDPLSELNPADLVNIIGKVVSVPKSVDYTRMGYEEFELRDIEVGDTAIFSYSVIYEMSEQEFSDVPLYKNMVMVGEHEFFVVDISKLFAVIKSDNTIKMLNGWVMLEHLEEANRIVLPNSLKRIARAKEGTLTQIGNPPKGVDGIDAQAGDRVLVHPFRIANYSIGEKKFSIARQKDLLGKVMVN